MSEELQVLKEISSQLWVIQWIATVCCFLLGVLVIFKVGKCGDDEGDKE